MARTISLLCSLGDITIGWEPDNDATVLPVIQQMINNGVRFFIVRKKSIRTVTKLTQVVDNRKVTIPDASLQALFAQGLLAIGSLLVGDAIGPDVARTAEEVAENDTVATQRVSGG